MSRSRGPEPGQALAHEPAQGARHRDLTGREVTEPAVALQLPPHLTEEEGVAAGRLPKHRRSGTDGGGVAGLLGGQVRRHFAGVEAGEVDAMDTGQAHELRRQDRDECRRVGWRVAMRGEEQHGQVGRALHDVAQATQPGLASPVEILQDHDHGAVGARAGHGRHDGAQRDGGERFRARLGRDPRGQHREEVPSLRRRRALGVGEGQLAPLDGGQQAAYGWYERVEGEAEVARAGPDEHGDAPRMQCPRGLHHQPGLARTRLARDEDELPYAVLDGGPDAFQPLEFGAAADPRRQLGGPGPLRRKCRWGPPGHVIPR